MKGYNGVAILSRLPLETPDGRDWCEKQDCRHALAQLPGGIELHNFYVPAGGDIPDPKVNANSPTSCTSWTRWKNSSRRKAAQGPQVILVGDLNVAPLET